MTATKPPMVPDAAEDFTDEDFAAATERVKATRDAALADPDVARMVEAKTAALARGSKPWQHSARRVGSPRHN